MELATQRLPNIVLLPPPVFLGHMIPFIELANKLVSEHNCTVTLVIPHDESPHRKPQKELLDGNKYVPTKITPVFLPPVATDDIPENENDLLEVIVNRVIRSLPSLRDALCSLRDSGTPAAVLVVDFLTADAIDVARELNIPAYMFYPPAATSLADFMELAVMKRSDDCSSDHESGPDRLPGSTKLSDNFTGFLINAERKVYAQVIDICKKQLLADGILVNSFLDMESRALRNLGNDGIPTVYPIGPLIRTGFDAESHQCLEWLDEQPRQSVLYVSFGSGGGLSRNQINELAIGLEMSEHRFLWVAKRPQENVLTSYLNTQSDHDLDFLPQGFLERTKGRGLVVTSWVPQVRVLSHASTGGFLMHCGWNAILESATFGVPIIGWPLCHDQNVNVLVVTDEMKVAIRVKANENGIVEREHISGVVKELMEGDEGKRIRTRMMDVKTAARKALMEDGSSAQALAKVVKKWSNGV